MTWFEQLTGFEETSADRVRAQLTIAGDTVTSRVNGQSFRCGSLTTPSLASLRTACAHDRQGSTNRGIGHLTVRQVVADVSDLHADPANAGAVFQVASQFNLLEMISPQVTPEAGVGIYENDHTQGPRCAIAAGAGTIYRNYFVHVPGADTGVVGQSATHQLDCLADLGHALGNANAQLWTMRNGYALASSEGLRKISQRLGAAPDTAIDQLRQALRIGIQQGTQVTIGNAQHTVTQAYCSALPVAYSEADPTLWEQFARLVLEAAYEATLCTAILQRLKTGNRSVFLTLLGGGAFGNDLAWIVESLARSLRLYRAWDLDVAIVSHRTRHPAIESLIQEEFSS